MPTGSPPPDPLDRDRFYSPGEPPRAAPTNPGQGRNPAGDADDDDYELEPLDPDVVAADQRRAEQAVTEATSAIDIDEAYRQRAEGRELDELLRDFKFRFQVKHLMMATAALAVFLSLVKLLGSPVAAVLLAALAALIAAHAYLAWRDRRREAALAARGAELERQRAGGGGGETDDPDNDFYRPLEPDPKPAPPLPVRFTVKEVMISLTIAAILLGVLSVAGWGAVAGVLGLLALAGLVASVTGVALPPLLVLGWWLTMLLYIVGSVIAYLAGTGTA